MTNEIGKTINITSLIDTGKITQFQVMVIALCAAVAFLDGIDSQSIAVGAPLIAAKLALPPGALGPIFSSALLGGTIGALTFGPLGDKFGRKGILTLATALFGVFTFLTAHVTSYENLLATRFLAGLGLGGATPCFISLACEYAPKRWRARVASLIWAAFPLGGISGGFLNAFILNTYGWETMFHLGGVLPLLVSGALLVWLPESLRFLIARNAATERVRRIVQRIRPDIEPVNNYVADEEIVHGVPLARLFTDGRGLPTLLLWVSFFMSFGPLAITVFWLPQLLREYGIGVAQASLLISVHGIGALIGIASAGRLIERFGFLPVLLPAFLIGAAVTSSLGYAASSLPATVVVLFCAGCFVGMAASGSIALATLIYPTAIRSSGVGWSMGMGRLGQMFTPLAAAAMATAGLSGQSIFNVFGIAPLLGAAAVIALRTAMARKSVLATE